MHQRQMDLLYRIILFASSALPIRRLEVAHFAPFNIGGRCVRLWRVQENNDRRLIAHRTWTVVDPEPKFIS